ncbi:MAG TPA: primosomal protein N' [Phycisphaerales bacterium]|nr:primosomal protein N' [Phycisphaerales bacterium]HMP36077.1 primosomal protein N' [Phycisphaerales bacterium]
MSDLPGLFDALDPIDPRAERSKTPPSIVRVAVERGFDRSPDGLSYIAPASLGPLAPGDRVLVPLGRGDTATAGFVIELERPGDAERPATAAAVRPEPSDLEGSAAPAERARADRPRRLKQILDRDPAGVSLPRPLVELANWLAAYYVAPIGVVFGALLPGAVKKRIGVVTRTLVDLAEAPKAAKPTGDAGDRIGAERSADAGGSAHSGEARGVAAAAEPAAPTDAAECARERGRPARPDRPAHARTSPQQRAVLAHLAGLPESERPIEIGRLAALLELGSRRPIEGLIRRGLLAATRRTAIEAAWGPQALDAAPPRTLTPAQAQVVDAVAATLDRGYSAHLLCGVTGSGKTEVYLRLIERVVAAGRTALMLVPEIALTPQTAGRVMARFPDRHVAILHSGLSAAQRNHQWSMVARGEAAIVLGARSAVLAPIPEGRLGLIVVDEEHDASYKQDQAPRYQGRDVALRRGQLERCPVLLGSATPSLESWHNAHERAAMALHRLPERAPGLTVPRISIVDFLAERRARDPADRRIHLIGPTLEAALARTLRDDGQAILLLNRRGWANYIACPDPRCGWKLMCGSCDAMMVCHVDRTLDAGRYVRCHHCLAEERLPPTCPRCGNRTTVFGLGTQRVEDELERTFPSLRSGKTMLRVDADTVERASALHDALARFGRGEVRVLLGTQMIAKGLDFPGVRLVGVISADTALALPDFRSAERTFQLVAQVAGRCGRGAGAGEAIVQTFEPHLPAILLAAAGDYEGFATTELEDRRRCGLPPATRMARIVVRDEDPDRCDALARRLADGLRRLLPTSEGAARRRSDETLTSPEPPSPIEIRGPFPCAIARIAGRHRRQIEILAQRPAPLQTLLAEARSAGIIIPGERVAVDVDPSSML